MKSIDEIVAALKAPFPESAVSWRAQTFNKDGDQAMALCYIDARDVMNRLDEVCGAFGWQSEHIVSNGGAKVTCKIGIKCPETEAWIWKSDGAGETDVEGEKGSYSDSLKRAAVVWGIGRYLYDREAVWCACESYKGGNGKFVFKKWIGNPGDKVKQPKSVVVPKLFANATLRNQYTTRCIQAYEAAETKDELNELVKLDLPKLTEMRGGDEHDQLAADEINKRYKARLEVLKMAEINRASFPNIEGVNHV